VLLALAGFFFMTNTVLVRRGCLWSKPSRLRGSGSMLHWSFPYTWLAGIAGLVSVSGQYVGWKTGWLIVPIMYCLFALPNYSAPDCEAERRRIVSLATPPAVLLNPLMAE